MSSDQEYLDAKLKKLYEELIEQSLIEKPKNIEIFLLDFLKVKTGESLRGAEREELIRVRLQVSQANNGKASESESDVSEDEDMVEDLPISIHPKKNMRTSVSAEAFGEWNQKSAYHPKVVQKPPATKTRLISRLEKSFMFSALDDLERNVIVNAMEEKRFAAGAQVITQGDDGYELFFVDSGKLECSKLFPGESSPKVLKIYEEGEAFGELSLLYNTPRAASIKALEDSVCWVIDRECFNHIVKEAAVKKRGRYEEFLSKVALLKNMDTYERGQLTDCLKSVEFNTGEFVIREGEWGDTFYMIEQGTAVATKVLKPGLPAENVKDYHTGEYFGELALIRGEPRAANIIATSQLKCATLDRRAFKRVLGPIEEILQRDAETYNKVGNRS